MTSSGTRVGTAVPEADQDADLRRDIGRGVVWAALSNIVMRIAGICVTGVIARILSPDEFGVFAIALAVFVVVTSLAELGMASAVARSTMEPADIAGTVSSISIIVSVGLATSMAVFAGPLATLLGMPAAASPIRVMSICLALTGFFAVPGAQLVREFRQDRIFLATIAGFVPANVVLIVLALMGQGAMAFAWSRVVGQVVTGLVFVACLNRRYLPEWRREFVGPLLRFGLPLSIANLINWTLLNADYLVLGRLLSAEAVGVYMIAFTVANWSTAVLGSILNGVVLPAFGRVGKDAGRLLESLVSSTRLVALVALPIAATSIALAPSLVLTVFGSKWAGAGPVLAVLAVYGACFAFTLLYVNVLVATGGTGRLLAVQVAWLVALVPAMVWGIKLGGLVGAAWAHVAVVLLVALPGYLWALRSRLGSLPIGLATTLLRPAGAAALAGGAAWMCARWIGDSVTGFLTSGLLAVVVYAMAARSMIVEDLPEVGRWLRRLSGRGRSEAQEALGPGGLRVGVVLEGLALGGCPIGAIDLARTLRDRGHHVLLLAVDEDVIISMLPYAEAAGFEVIRLPARAGLMGRARQLRRHAREHDLDVIHVFAPWLGRAAVLACGLRHRRIAVVHNWMMENEFPITARTALIVGTGAMHTEALAMHGQRTYLLEPPVDLARDQPDPSADRAFRREHGFCDDDLLMVLVGRLDQLNPGQRPEGIASKLPGIWLALDALTTLDDPRLRLVVVGDGNAMEQVRARVEVVNRDLGRDAVVLTGSLADPRPAYAAADIGLAMGGSALRVLAHGRPLVVLGHAGFSELFAPGSLDRFSGGFYGTEGPADPTQHFISHLHRLAEPGARHRLGEWGLRLVRERYGLDAGAEHLEMIYRDSLSRRDPWWRRLGDAGYLAGRDVLGQLIRRLQTAQGAP